MVAEDTSQIIESILNEEDLARIKEEFKISVSIKLELPGPFERIIKGSVTRMALYEEAFWARSWLPLPTIIIVLQ